MAPTMEVHIIETYWQCFDFDEMSSPTGLNSASSISGFTEEDSLPESSSDGQTYAGISCY